MASSKRLLDDILELNPSLIMKASDAELEMLKSDIDNALKKRKRPQEAKVKLHEKE